MTALRDELRAAVAAARAVRTNRMMEGAELISSGLALMRVGRMSDENRLIWADAPFEGWELPVSAWELRNPRADLVRGMGLVIAGLEAS